MSPDGPGIIVEVDGKEAFLPAETAAEWISVIGYTVMSPMRISFGAEPTLRKGKIIIETRAAALDRIVPPEVLHWLKEYLHKHPAELAKLRSRGMPQNWPDGELVDE
jgi:hypothetical protein